jgi:hypothetical protein
MPEIALYLSTDKHLFDYLGLQIYLSINDNKPLTFYGRSEYDTRISKAVIHLKDGIYKGIDILKVGEFEELDENEKRQLMKLIDANLSDIIKYWIDFYVYKKEVPFERILKPLI